MAREDTVRLLRECNAGVKTGCRSLEQTAEQVKSRELKDILLASLQDHVEIGNRIHALLSENNSEGKNPNACMRCMSKWKIAVKMRMFPHDSTAAALIHDGCNMGIRSLCRYLNQYPSAEEEAKELAQELIDLEAQLMVDLRPYL